jgi:hypothetical protein
MPANIAARQAAKWSFGELRETWQGKIGSICPEIVEM